MPRSLLLESGAPLSSEIDKLLPKNVEADASKWSDVVGIIPNLSPETRQRAITLLSQQASAMRQHSDVGILWSKLRGQLHHHRSYPNADWAMDAKDTEALGLVYQELTPSDPVAAHTWLFNSWPDFPDGQLCKSTEASRRIKTKREERQFKRLTKAAELQRFWLLQRPPKCRVR